MPTAPKDLQNQTRFQERKSPAMERAIQQWMTRRARIEADRAIKEQLRGKVSKAADGSDQELFGILMRYGVAHAKDSAMRVASTTKGLDQITDPQNLRAEMQSKEFKLKVFQSVEGWAAKRTREISKETRRMVKRSVKTIIDDALRQVPRPSTGEIARRIRTAAHGNFKDRVYAFSPERAAVIARTELVQADGVGRFEGYKAAGVKKKKWLAYKDGRSGDRHHEKLDGVVVGINERFETHLGNKLRFPGDPSAPIEDTANCRCSMRAVIVED